MRIVLQRVAQASVTVDANVVGQIERGLLILLGVAESDTESDVDYMVEKAVNLRIFSDQDGKFNLSLLDTKGEMLVVSQFTLLADTRKGRRPNFIQAAKEPQAIKLYEDFVAKVRKAGVAKVATGSFGAHMDVNLLNDGPVTIVLDSQKRDI
ncbi:MAG: D-aminoacyl-tRNA deacylase [Oligoflexales bacterium]